MKLATLLVVLACVSAGATQRFDLKGNVTDPKGAPIEGATVYIYTASVREGTSPFCPSCYPDCGKKAKTDAKGAFAIDSLDPSLLFKVLVVAEGYTPKFIDKTAPERGAVELHIGRIPDKRLNSPNNIRGRVVDPSGDPIEGAAIEPFGYKTDVEENYGDPAGIDPLVISNKNGEFVLTSSEPYTALFAGVGARGFARQKVHNLSPTGPNLITLEYGVEAKGRIEQDGIGAGSIEVGIAQTNLEAGIFLGEHSVATDSSGFFAIPNLPANTELYVYGKSASLQGKGVIVQKKFVSGANGSVIDLGALSIEKGFRVRGRVVLSDGGVVPPKTRIYFGRDDAWDSLVVEADAEGHFEANALAPGFYDINLRIGGYTMSRKTAEQPGFRGSKLILKSDFDDVLVIMDRQ